MNFTGMMRSLICLQMQEVIRFMRWQMRFSPGNTLNINIEDTLSKAEL